MKKTKILIANDSSLLGTGYGVYGKELLTRLQKTGKYEIAEIACYTTLDHPSIKKSEWKIYPNAPCKDDPKEIHQQYSQSPTHAFGSWRFNNVLIHFKPDIVFDVRDYWMYAYQEVSPFRNYFKWVVMPTVDSAPQKQEWLHTFSNMDLVVPYTDWAKKTLINQCGNSINLFPDIANAGVDLDSFVPPANRKEFQRQVFEKEVSITGAVMRNQKRKLFPDIFKAYRAYLDRLLANGKKDLYDQSYLYLHTSYPEFTGWDLPQLLMEFNMLDKTYFTSICRTCSAVYPTKFHEGILKCRNCNSATLIIPNATNPVPTEALVKVYQLFDFFIQVAICEGFGMPQVEAAACGIPIASVDYSAMTEIVQKLNGTPIPVQRLWREMETGADRAYPDVEGLINILYNFHVNLSQEEKDNKGKETRRLCEKYYSWDGVADVWDRAFDSVDISSNLDWNGPKREINNHNVPKDLTALQFIEYIVKEIIGEPSLLKTAPIRQIIKDFTNGFSLKGGSVRPVNPQDVITSLEEFLNGKVVYENMRQNPEKLFKEPYLNV